MSEKEKICPSCSNAVPEIAYKCQFCGYYFEPENISPAENKIKYFISKLPSIMLGILIVLAVLSLGFLILNPFFAAQKTPSNTAPSPSVKNTNTPLPAETPTPSATPTITPTPDPYFLLASEKFSNYQNYYNEFNEYQQEAAADPSLILDRDWKIKMSLTLRNLKISADELANLQPTPVFAQFHAFMQNAAEETHLMADAYALGIDYLDPQSIKQANIHLKNLTFYLKTATKELLRIQSAP